MIIETSLPGYRIPGVLCVAAAVAAFNCWLLLRACRRENERLTIKIDNIVVFVYSANIVKKNAVNNSVKILYIDFH
jgi:hypothetical protein